MRIILYVFLFVLLGFQKISADTFRSIESERINKRDSLLSIITGAKISDNIISITDFGAIGDGVKMISRLLTKQCKVQRSRVGLIL